MCTYAKGRTHTHTHTYTRTHTQMYRLFLNTYVALSAGAVEYTDCTSAEELDSTNECPGYDTKQSDSEVPAI